MSKLIGFEEFRELFHVEQLEVGEEMYSKFARYAELLCEWNEKINLTAITDPEGIVVKHFFDSVYPFTLVPPKSGARLIDVGTGAGFPAIPLKIYRDDIEITLLDSLNKRVNFLKAVTEELGVTAECVHSRAEDGAKFTKSGNVMRESFDISCARAVADLRVLCEYCLPFVKVGGSFYALKGRSGEDELKDAGRAVKVLGGKVGEVKKYSLPNGDERVLILIEKTAHTSQKYPRNPGQMKKETL